MHQIKLIAVTKPIPTTDVTNLAVLDLHLHLQFQ